jgi:hypothetical protein
MRKVQAFLGLALLVSATGCPQDGGRFNLLRPTGVSPITNEPPPPKEDLVAYLNRNSELIRGIKSNDVSLTYYGSPIGAINIGGRLCAQGPRNFRLGANSISGPEVDLGSNDHEFWYWIARGEPKYQVFCSYQALEQGRVQYMPFPFQPEWVLEAMGMGKYGPAEKYELVAAPGKYKLIEHTKSPQGTPVKKIIVFNSTVSKNKDEPQVTDFELREEAGDKLICSAHISRRQVLPNSKAEIPREMKLRWPEAKLELGLQINNPQETQQFPPQIFVRTPLKGVPSFDLATRQLEAVQQAGSWQGPKK